MPGVKGMVESKPRPAAVRNRIWKSIRILRRFTQPDLVRTSPPASIDNVRKFLKRLEVHGYVAKTGCFTGGRPGRYQSYRLVRDHGPTHPLRCERCGRPLCEKCTPEKCHE
jgi:hypothetical protein